MTKFNFFLSVVLVVRNQSNSIPIILSDIEKTISNIASDYELIIVDNASNDNSNNIYSKLTSENGMANLQIYMLTKIVDSDVAYWVGAENALGDFVVFIDPLVDDIKFLPKMLYKTLNGAEVVYAKNLLTPVQKLSYRTLYGIFNFIYKISGGIDFSSEAPRYSILSKRVINFISQHTNPSVAFRYLPALAGFARVNLDYSSRPRISSNRQLREGFDRGMRLLFSTTRIPMRIVTWFSLLAATVNFLYAMYVIGIGIFKADVAPGWLSLSLQQSVMFFLISIVLFVIGEYIIQMVALSTEGPLYHIAHELNSATMTRREKLNIEETKLK
jgi:hypothetical protein